MTESALSVEHLRVQVGSGAPIVEDVSFALDRGEILGVVGESGSGKTTMSLALLGYARPGAHIAGGSVRIGGEEILGRAEPDARAMRGKRIAYVPQDPGVALNPSIRIGAQIEKVLQAHGADGDLDARAAAALDECRLPSDRDFRRRYPHQLSGGQQQRVAIAIALVGRPPVVVLDEPTTGLDVVTQAQILAEIARLRDELGIAVVYVTHNLAVISEIATRIAVMYAGWLVEEGPADAVLAEPHHPYARGLIQAIPDYAHPHRLVGIPGVAVGVDDRPPGCPFAPRCAQKAPQSELEMPPTTELPGERRVRCFAWRQTPPLTLAAPRADHVDEVRTAPLLEVVGLGAEHRGRREVVTAARDVSFAVSARESLAVVGESGSGKTTIARCIAGLHAPTAGEIRLDGVALPALAGGRSREARRRIQIVFQNPYDSLNPRRTIVDQLAWPAHRLRQRSMREAQRDAAELLERVRLPARVARRYPQHLSGGERQRVAIARALAAAPDVLVCDEVTSALDVSVQAAVLDVLEDLRDSLGLAMVFITHDLGVVASVCDHVLVLEQGEVREQGTTSQLLKQPQDQYTRRLIGAAPRLPTADSVAG